MSVEQRGPVSVLVVAIGGYGYYYLQALLDDVPASSGRLAGIVDPDAARSRGWERVQRLGAPVHDSIESFYEAGHRAELAVIASPIHWHVPQSITALRNGSHVLCEKPLSGSADAAASLLRERDAARRFVMVGYQWSFSRAIQELKRDIMAGLFGKPLRFSALCCWPRDHAYYRRNRWAGRLRDPDTGWWVRDSPANNAMAHYLQNLLYLAGPRVDVAAWPASVEAEMYRAYPLESCDTVACRVALEAGPEVLFYATHASETAIEPRFTLRFEEAVVTRGEDDRAIVAIDTRGHLKEYGSPDDTPQFQKLFDAIDSVRRPRAVVCGIEAAMTQTAAIEAMHASVPEIAAFPAALTREDGSRTRLYVAGLADVLCRCYQDGRLPAEAGVEWASPGRPAPCRRQPSRSGEEEPQ